MTTAVDSSVLLDVLGADPRHGNASREALREAFDGGALIACDVVWAEVRAHYGDDAAFAEAVRLLGIRFEALSEEAARLAGRLWREHRARRRGAARDRVMADFLIGAHAMLQADRLLARDRGFYRAAFTALRVVDPSR